MTPMSPSVSPRPRRHRAVALLLLSLVVMLAIGASVGLFFTDHLVRLTFIHRLCSDDAEKQQYAIGYVARHIDDRATFTRARDKLLKADGPCFDTVVQGLDAAGVWGPRFGPAYLRRLARRLPDARPQQRAAIAVTLGRTLFEQRPGHDHPQLLATLDPLLEDPEPVVRLNALSAAAALPPDQRSSRIRPLLDDPDPAVARRADRLHHLLAARDFDPPPPPDPDRYDQPLRRLAELEPLPSGSIDEPAELERTTPPLIRLHRVRTASEADPLDLVPVFESEHPTLRDLATVIALDRFDREPLHALAAELIGRFADPPRRSGAILAAMSEPDDELRDMLRTRLNNRENWISEQHYRLALFVAGELDEPFDPTTLLLHEQMPRTTVIMAMLYTGDLRGLDWLLNPLGEPGVGNVRTLRFTLDTARYHAVIRHFLPNSPPFDPWAEPPQQREQIHALRDWYLLHRHQLRFDPAARQFHLPNRDQRQDSES